MRCDSCDIRFKCYTERGFKCTEPYSDSKLREWRDLYSSLTLFVNEELADRKINREILAWKTRCQ